jgi:hypothetical protein
LVVGNFTDSRPCWCCAEEKRGASPTSSMNVIITRRVSRFGDSALTSFILHSLLHLPCLIPRRVSRFGDSALTSFILHSLLHLPCLTFSFTYLLLPTESPRRETLRRRKAGGFTNKLDERYYSSQSLPFRGLCAYFLYTTFSPSLALPYFLFHLSPASDRVPEAGDSAEKKFLLQILRIGKLKGTIGNLRGPSGTLEPDKCGDACAREGPTTTKVSHAPLAHAQHQQGRVFCFNTFRCKSNF